MDNMIEDQLDECRSSATRATRMHHNIFIRLWKKAYRWGCRWNERRKAANTLARMSSGQLKDIGLSRDDVKRDHSGPFGR